MNKSYFHRTSIQTHAVETLVNITSITFSNYSADPVSLIIDGIETILPAPQTIGGVLIPMPWSAPCPTGYFELTYELKFAVKTGNVVIDYFQVKPTE